MPRGTTVQIVCSCTYTACKCHSLNVSIHTYNIPVGSHSILRPHTVTISSEIIQGRECRNIVLAISQEWLHGMWWTKIFPNLTLWTCEIKQENACDFWIEANQQSLNCRIHRSSCVPTKTSINSFQLLLDLGTPLEIYQSTLPTMGKHKKTLYEHFTLSHTSWWSPPGVHLDSIRIPWNFAGVHQESIRTPLIFVRGTPGGFQEFTWTPDGVLRNSTGLMEFFRTPLWCPDGVQQEDSIWSPSGLRTENLKIEKIKVVPNRMFYISI